MEDLTTLLEQGLMTVQWELDDWTIEKFEGQDILFFKGNNYIPYNGISQGCFTITKQQDTQSHPGELEMHNAI